MIRTAVRTVMTAGVVAAVAVGGVAIGQQLQGGDPAPEPASQTVDVATTGPQVVEPGATLEAKPRQVVEPTATATTSTVPATVAATVDGDPAATTQEQTVTSPEPTPTAAEPTQSAAPAAEQTTAAADPSVPPTLGTPEQPSPGPHNQ